MDNLRASFAFNKVIATKFEQFCKTHFRVDETLRLGVLSIRVERHFVDESEIRYELVRRRG